MSAPAATVKKAEAKVAKPQATTASKPLKLSPANSHALLSNSAQINTAKQGVAPSMQTLTSISSNQARLQMRSGATAAPTENSNHSINATPANTPSVAGLNNSANAWGSWSNSNAIASPLLAAPSTQSAQSNSPAIATEQSADGKESGLTIPQSIGVPLSKAAESVSGYTLLRTIIGKDIFTQNAVPSDAEAIIHEFMILDDKAVGEQQFSELKDSGCIPSYTTWLTSELKNLDLTWQHVVSLVSGIASSLTWKNLASPFATIIPVINEPISRLQQFLPKLVFKTVEVLLAIMNVPAELIHTIIKNATQSYEEIKKNPLKFLKNILDSAVLGFKQFAGKISENLVHGMKDWFKKILNTIGIKTPPTAITPAAIFGSILEIFDINENSIWKKIGQEIGEEKAQSARATLNKTGEAFSFMEDVKARGPIVLWEKIQAELSDLWETVKGSIISWLSSKLFGAAFTQFITSLNPVGAIVNGLRALFNAVQSFRTYFTELLELLNSFLGNLNDVAKGNLTQAANKFEGLLKNSLPVAIGFIAHQLGIDDIANKLKEMLDAVKARVDQAITTLIKKTAAGIKTLIGSGKQAISKLTDWAKKLLGTDNKFNANDGTSHRLFFAEKDSDVELRLNPDPAVPYEEWIGKLKIDTKNEAQAKAKSEAIAIYRSITKIREEIASKTATPDQIENKEKDKLKRVKEQLEKLGNKIKLLLALPPNLESIGKENRIIYAPLHRSGFGEKMDATFLVATDYDTGSGVGVTYPKKYQNIIQRRSKTEKQGTFYVLGHLLNKLLGGSGKKFENLTPLTAKSNPAHQRLVESIAKTQLKKGNILSYQVEAKYGRQPVTAIATTQTPDIEKIQSIMNDERDIVPTRLICNASLLTPKEAEENFKAKDSKKNTGLKLIPETTIENEISQDTKDYIFN